MTVFLYLKLLTVTTGNRHNKTKQRTGSNQIFKIVLFSRACFSRTRLTLKMEAFSFVGLTPNGRPWSQAFLAENVETGDNNRDDFHCMQMSLVMSMPFIFRDVSTVRNIPKFKDRANWSRDTFQPMRRRVCVYQQTNQNIAAVIKTADGVGQNQSSFRGSQAYF